MWSPGNLILRYCRRSPSFQFAGAVGLATLVTLEDRIDSRLVVRCHEREAATSSSSCRSRRKKLETFLRKQTEDEFDWESLPIYTSAEVAKHNGTDNQPVWMSYGGFVYNVTQFIPMHPGGTERISRAAGAAMEPYWYLHTQHFETDEPRQILSGLVVGRLDESDQERIDAQVDALQEKMDSFRLEFHSAKGNAAKFTLLGLQDLPKTDRVSPIGCASKGGPLQTQLFGGVLLRDLVKHVDGKPISTDDYTVVFHALDGEYVRLERVKPDNDILIAYEEDGAPLSQGRGFPLRVIIPNKRVVKWVCRIDIER